MKTLFLIASLFFFQNVRADLGGDLKTLGLSSLYGAIGGTLVGVAAMAIGGNSKNIAKGASIGLYAGLGIGGYFVVKDNLAPKGPAGEGYPTDSPSKIYDNARANDYDDIYYAKRWEMVGDWRTDPLDYNFQRQLNKLQTKSDLTIFFNLFQKNF